jgi:hypothetical protein
MSIYRQKLLKEINITKRAENLSKCEWIDISRNKGLTEEFIREFQDEVSWIDISTLTISLEFIREFQEQVKWYNICQCQVLTEDFIREFQDRVFWDYISTNQKVSDEFLLEFNNKIHWNWYFKVRKISFWLIKKLIFKGKLKKIDYNELNIKHLTENQKMDIYKMLTMKQIFVR